MHRLVRRAIGLLLLLLILPTAAMTIMRIIGGSLTSPTRSGVPTRSDPLSQAVTAVFLALFLIGLAIRTGRALRHGDSAGAREHERRERRARLAGRRPAEDVPIHQPGPVVSDDPDPAAPFGDD